MTKKTSPANLIRYIAGTFDASPVPNWYAKVGIHPIGRRSRTLYFSSKGAEVQYDGDLSPVSLWDDREAYDPTNPYECMIDFMISMITSAQAEVNSSGGIVICSLQVLD